MLTLIAVNYSDRLEVFDLYRKEFVIYVRLCIHKKF